MQEKFNFEKDWTGKYKNWIAIKIETFETTLGVVGKHKNGNLYIFPLRQEMMIEIKEKE